MTSSDNATGARDALNLRLKAIKLVVFDVDGVLTDGRLYYSAQGEALKVFNVKDGVGIKLLHDCQVQVAIMTAKDSPMVAQRMADLGIKHYFAGVKDKRFQLDALATQEALAPAATSRVPSSELGSVNFSSELVFPVRSNLNPNNSAIICLSPTLCYI